MAHNTLYEIVPSSRALLTIKLLTNALVVLGRVEDAIYHHSLCERATGDEVSLETATNVNIPPGRVLSTQESNWFRDGECHERPYKG